MYIVHKISSQIWAKKISIFVLDERVEHSEKLFNLISSENKRKTLKHKSQSLKKILKLKVPSSSTSWFFFTFYSIPIGFSNGTKKKHSVYAQSGATEISLTADNIKTISIVLVSLITTFNCTFQVKFVGMLSVVMLTTGMLSRVMMLSTLMLSAIMLSTAMLREGCILVMLSAIRLRTIMLSARRRGL